MQRNAFGLSPLACHQPDSKGQAGCFTALFTVRLGQQGVDIQVTGWSFAGPDRLEFVTVFPGGVNGLGQRAQQFKTFCYIFDLSN
ncbi:MAG: hypothetical protein MUP90_10710, partial [Gammaproteobacteria bacterium]|nr:hypothetical protein [Gammaproteobacteria bacterium]